MKTIKPPRVLSHVEPLESRIAPAVLVNGPNLFGGFGNPSIGEMSLGENSVTLVKVLAGQVVVWFQDGDISTVSFGAGASFELFGNVGDIVGNLDSGGRLSDSDNDPSNGEDGNILLPNDLAGMKINPFGNDRGSLGNIITAGSISNVTINGEVNGIYAGDGVFHATSDAFSGGDVTVDVGFDVNPLTSGDQTVFTFNPATPAIVEDANGLPINLTNIDLIKGGAAVRNVTIAVGNELQIITGNGSPTGASSTLLNGVPGGAIENLKIKSAIAGSSGDSSTPSYELITGNGGSGKIGGAGGSITNVVEETSVGNVFYTAGNGGNGLVKNAGDGGSIRLLDLRSDSARYEFRAGNGGNGANAGNGGGLFTGNFSNLTPTGGIIRAADLTGDGADDLIIIDASSGRMVVMENDGTGSSFTPLVQYHDGVADEDVIFVSPAGTTPSDAAVADFDHSGTLDVIVTYENSNSISIFYNYGGGSFYNEVALQFSVASFSFKYSPSFVIPVDLGNTSELDFMLVENRAGSSVVHYLSSGLTLAGFLVYNEFQTGEYPALVNDVAWTSDLLDLNTFFAFSDGHVGQIRGSFSDLQDAGIVLPEAITQIDVSSDDTQVLALGAGGRTVKVAEIGTGGFTLTSGPVLTVPGKAIIAQFVKDGDPSTDDAIALLYSSPAGSHIDVYRPQPVVDPLIPVIWTGPTVTSSLNPLKNFAVAYSNPGETPGFAALGAALNQFTFSLGGGEFEDFVLPFTGKRVFLFGGDGGTGLDLGLILGKGGNGGSIGGINIVATDIQLIAGDGGAAANGGGGSGGSINNGATVVKTSGTTLLAKLKAENSLVIEAGDGNSPTGPGGKKATGGAGGGVAGISAELKAGMLNIKAGNAGNGAGAAGGAGGSITGSTLIDHLGDLVLTAGTGGNATGLGAAGGAGGSITGLNYKLPLGSEEENDEIPYSATLNAGQGGTATAGRGGDGGGIQTISLTVDPSNRSFDDPSTNPPTMDAHLDNTFRLVLLAGSAGDGSIGGHGGAIRGIKYTVVHDQGTPNNGVLLNYASIIATAGDGGNGSAGDGGHGGEFSGAKLVGVTSFDPDSATPIASPVNFTAGRGGNGTGKGGNGGGITGVTAVNARFGEEVETSSELIGTNMLFGAELVAGAAGSGGSGVGGIGGGLSVINLSTQGGRILGLAGDGGGSTSSKGGAGGAVRSVNVAAVSSLFDTGVLLVGGSGGTGATLGGLGGALSALNLNGPLGKLTLAGQTTEGQPIVLLAGDGGGATAGAGKAGNGGDINGVNQGKDLFGAISAIIAGNGGNAATGVAGKGGSVLNVHAVGFIGKPTAAANRLGVFDDLGAPQGIFAGRGGTGATAGLAGSVMNITARQISAIGAAPNAGGVFAAAEKVSNVKADLIGYDVDSDGAFDGATLSPGSGVPVDGFLLAKVVSGVTGSRVAFTFTA